MNREQMIEIVRNRLTMARARGLDPATDVVNAILPQVSTVEELEALPVGTKFIDKSGDAWQSDDQGGRVWTVLLAGYERRMWDDPAELLTYHGPLTVVWTPESAQTAARFATGGVS